MRSGEYKTAQHSHFVASITQRTRAIQDGRRKLLSVYIRPIPGSWIGINNQTTIQFLRTSSRSHFDSMSTKTLTVGLANKSHTKAIITPADSTTPSYELDLSWFTKELFTKSTKQSIVMRSASTTSSSTSDDSAAPSTPILGSCVLPFVSLSQPIQLCFGDPDSKSAVWESIFCRETLKSNGFELNIDLGGTFGRRTFDWKRTHAIEGMGALKRELDYLHLKMVERETGRVLARFKHHCWYGQKRGELEIEEYEGGEGWEVVVVLSGMAVLEYLRKLSGYSF